MSTVDVIDEFKDLLGSIESQTRAQAIFKPSNPREIMLYELIERSLDCLSALHLKMTSQDLEYIEDHNKISKVLTKLKVITNENTDLKETINSMYKDNIEVIDELLEKDITPERKEALIVMKQQLLVYKRIRDIDGV